MYNAVRLLFFLLARSIFSKSTISYHWGFECVLGIYSMENVKQHAWIYGSSQQLSNNITCYRKERKQNILPRSFRCVIFFALFILLCCCSNLLWLLLLLSMVRLWQRNVHRLYHIILFFFAQRKREREKERMKRETKCKICEYLHNWMIWYSIRQFECLSSLWCVRVERPTSSKDRFVYISSLSHSMLLHLFKEIFRTTYTSVTREREEVREKTKISGSFGRMHQERQS